MRIGSRRWGVGFVLLAVGLAGRAEDRPAEVARNLILITIDGMRWQEVFGGFDPLLVSDVAGGVVDPAKLRAEFARTSAEEGRAADAIQHLRRGCPRLLHRVAADHERHRDVLERREFRQQVMELVDEPQRTIAHAPALRLRERREGTALHEHLAAGRRVEATEQMRDSRPQRARW